MTLTLPISKRGGLTLPPSLRRKLGLDGIESPLVIVEERDGGLFLQPAAAVPVRDIPVSCKWGQAVVYGFSRQLQMGSGRGLWIFT